MRDRVSGDAAADDGRPGEDDPRARLERERGEIAWAELVRHFARGVVLRVDARVELVDAALCLAEDDTARLQGWLEDGSVARASDDDARDWTVREPRFLCVVAAPWVLVQELERGDAADRAGGDV